MIFIYPSKVSQDSTGVLVVLKAQPNRAVTWGIVSGAGTLTPITSFTDAQGRALAHFVPAGLGTTVVGATYGA